MIFTNYTSKRLMNKTCYFSGATLKDYIENLPIDFKDYNIQRGIVSNVYLDKIVETILNKGHIPAITLVAYTIGTAHNDSTITINEFKILDGLQRTYRLKIVWDTILFYESIFKHHGEDLKTYSKFQLTRNFSKQLREISSSTLVLERLIQSEMSINQIINCFDEIQWFEIWEGLSPEEEVDKMLLLNAGHKQVSLRHQLELLYLNLVPYLDQIKGTHNDLVLLREKDVSASSYSKARKQGQFHFSHIITSALAFLVKDTITTNANLISKIQDHSTNEEQGNYSISYSFLNGLVEFLLKFDDYLVQFYNNDIGIQWISRDTVTIGLFGALGKYADNKYSLSHSEVFERFLGILTSTQTDLLRINEYNNLRSNLDLSRVNIGDVTKKAVYWGILKLLENGDPIDWKECFRGADL
ncbi:hypothetical protein [Paenibacillus glycinis]|uniref:DUF262 domain-containing protein n=1 Tax=Paenibacillus glycinis TaxID=2697035 RepID=A0ABW9XSL3_9BACL|nr:hypothetical protein [Paenibacillus glycinis]NBD25639.1 hypothetical protein [Paenibacillus glycinis]